MPLPKQAVSFRQLRSEGLTKLKILALCSSLRLFPTPFKGIYYVPLEEERKGAFIENPLKILSQAVALFLGSNEFYFSCRTAQEALGLNWQPSGEVHIVNPKLSRRISLKEKIELSQMRGTWRSRKIAKLLSFYGNEIIFHRGEVAGAKTKQTPYGRFALRSQITADRKRFKEKHLRGLG
ncbi:hypothetical protein J4441_03220 [Candidatus Micrarchaeota archaeon]|nr:hypothetical protein [Candidatus Micrarchaeota archaeon]